MFNKIAIFNSSLIKIQIFIDLLDGLAARGYNIYFFYSKLSEDREIKEKKWLLKKIYFGPRPEKLAGAIFFIAFSPLLFLIFFLLLVFYKYNKKTSSVICLGWNEKIIITPLARILKMKIIWIEDCYIDYKELNKFIFWLYKIIFRSAKIIVYGSYNKVRLEKLLTGNKEIFVVNPGIKLNQCEHQGDIFSQMAQEGGRGFRKKFFTVGTVIDLDKEQKVEALFQAVKKCSTIASNIQLVVVGDGEERKNLSWISKKIEIDSFVWFVGEQNHLKKWIDSFDLYIVAKEKLTLNDIKVILKAMAAGLPVIGPSGSILESIIEENKTGCLLELDNSEMLSRQIIKLYRDKRLKLMLGQYGRDAIKEEFNLEKMVSEVEKIIVSK
jgi:glycosyltransferase involved in cell wall biosynthesis